MTDKIKNTIIKFKENGEDLLDLRTIKNKALELKMYDLIVYINNNIREYLSFVNSLKK